MITVRVAKMGDRTQEVRLPSGSTVQDALEGARLYPVPSGHQVRLNNEPTDLDASVRDGDIVTLVPKVRAG